MTLLTLPHPGEAARSIRAKALVFEDEKSREVLKRIERVAPSEANVLICGETGTGKELVARHIHELSSRCGERFVAVNCAALNDGLIESELFGHERGAFTGALTAKEGWFQAAQGGTLFLDEIGDLSLSLQTRLLRVLQEREVTRIGSRRPVPIDVRVLAATNVRLEEAVMAGRFRSDLYFRLNVAAIHLPPLRERPGDILPLAEYFLRFFSERLQYSPKVFSEAARAILRRHHWPGNIRELENAVHHALLVSRHPCIQPEDLALSHLPLASVGGHEEAPTDRLEQALLDLFETAQPDLYNHVEHALLRAAFRYCGYNQLRTARLLGISRNVVRDRLIRYGELKAARPLTPA